MALALEGGLRNTGENPYFIVSFFLLLLVFSFLARTAATATAGIT